MENINYQTTLKTLKNKKTNIIQLVFVIMFSVIISIFPILMICGVSAGKNYEQKVLAKLPEIQELFLNYPSFSGDFEAYYNDHFPLKSKIVQQYSLFKYKVFKSSILPSNTSIGKNGWLFYEDYNTRPVVSGQYKLSNSQLKIIYNGIITKYNKLKSIGKQYIIYIAPEKQMIYPEYDKLFNVNYTCADQLVSYLIKNNCPVPIIYGKDYLISNKDKGQLYFKYDTHWNDFGSYIGYVDIMKRVVSLFPEKNITIADEYKKTTFETSGDLAGTLFLTEYLKEKSPKLIHKYNYSYQVGDDGFGQYVSETQSELKVFIYGDSFSDANFWASHFVQSASQVRILHNKNNFKTLLKYIGNSDIVIEECVQRAITNLSNCDF